MIIPSSYPVQGIFYMLGHPQLFSNLICPILITMIWAIAALIFGFAYLLKLQAHALINVNCPAAVAWIVSIIFVLLEVAVMIILFYLIILPIYQDGLFDRVLKLRGLRHVLKQNEGNDVIKCMRGVHGGLLIVFFQASVRFILNFDVVNTWFAEPVQSTTPNFGLWMTLYTKLQQLSSNPPADIATPSQCIPYLLALQRKQK
ncbi:hypothetical protein BGZ74_000040 [Mortierella antarctica]|nr:hypothetical protein BGZ74_000040 [Mortierella antarctica]